MARALQWGWRRGSGAAAEGRLAQTPIAFVVLTSPRSGSTWLVQTMNRAAGVTAYGELFLANRMQTWGASDVPPYDAYRSAGRFPRVIRYTRGVLDRPGNAAVGFKLMYGQARRHPTLWAYLMARRVRIIHLVRENSLDVAISRQVAAQTGRFHAEAADVSDAPDVQVDTRQLVRDIRSHRRWVSAARRLGGVGASPWLELRYESLVAFSGRELGRLGAFLGVELVPAGSTPDSLKRPGGAGGHRIANLAEVRTAVTEAGYASLLGER